MRREDLKVYKEKLDYMREDIIYEKTNGKRSCTGSCQCEFRLDDWRERMQTVASIQQAISPIAKAYGLKRVYLFGSYANGTATEENDVDILIEMGEILSLLELSEILKDANEALNIFVDLVIKVGMDKEFEDDIAGSEVLLYEG